MRTAHHILVQKTGSVSVPLEMPPHSAARPVRRGQFWPGESFGACTRKWDLTGAFAGHAFVLPALLTNSGHKL